MKRRILRNRARLNMKKAGITRQNKCRWVRNAHTGLLEWVGSFFARHWQEYTYAPISPRRRAGV